MKFILGTKQKMTQYFADDGTATAATMLTVSPLTITQVKSADTDGYDAVQVGFGVRNEKNVNKAQRSMGNFKTVKEFRLVAPTEYKKGDTINPADILEVGTKVNVIGTSKGKGFQGVVKRHGFAGGRRTHGQKHSEREPGSIGATGPQRVFKGTRMPGRMGTDRTTVKNLEVLAFDADSNTVLVKGAVPGKHGTLLEIITQ